ncbi:Hypothetical protein NTJ_03183 [Nesidiocoris tenuis]|uniref:Uncharacterized protein n=1 Tax=Nesidiocoris tenuis TaxID=355587 RepID=A0ABN7AHN2_9HEMI|nr:Hypothetical protein NTJ_03183 [Nesidiocoris tenuis]
MGHLTDTHQNRSTQTETSSLTYKTVSDSELPVSSSSLEAHLIYSELGSRVTAALCGGPTGEEAALRRRAAKSWKRLWRHLHTHEKMG